MSTMADSPGGKILAAILYGATQVHAVARSMGWGVCTCGLCHGTLANRERTFA